MKLSSSQVLYEKEDGIARITLNRPETGNMITRKMFTALNEAVDEAIRDLEVRVVIFRGSGDHFCRGFDGGDPEIVLNSNEEGTVDWMFRREANQLELDLWLKIQNMRKPAIGAIKGSVMGGGWTLAMVCDCLISTETATFDNLEYALGLGYTLYTPFDAWKIPMNFAKLKAFTGEVTTAEEGYRLGLVNQIVPEEKLDAAADRLARRMLRLAPYTLAAHKEIYNLAYNLMGMQNIIPFAKETFNIGLQLPGTPENQALWDYAHTHTPDEFRQYVADRIVAIAEEDKKPL